MQLFRIQLTKQKLIVGPILFICPQLGRINMNTIEITLNSKKSYVIITHK